MDLVFLLCTVQRAAVDIPGIADERGTMIENHPNYDAGKAHGEAIGSWVEVDDADAARKLLADIRDGEHFVMDMAPHPLSGEMAGQSMPELEDRYGISLEDTEDQDRFVEGFDAGYWDTVTDAARSVLGLAPGDVL